MKLILLRHSLAVSKDAAACTFDAERQLDPQGRRHAAAAADFLRDRGLCPSRILSSPFRRSAETANALRDALGGEVEAVTSLAPGAGLDDLFNAIGADLQTPATVAAVLHEPDVGHMLTALLMPGDQPFPLSVYPGDVFALHIECRDGQSRAVPFAFYSPMREGN